MSINADTAEQLELFPIKDESVSINLDDEMDNDTGDDSDIKEKIDPRSTFPPEGSKRWKEIYREKKEAERKLKEAEEREASTKAIIDEMRKHNQALVESMKDTVLSINTDKETKSNIDELQASLKQLTQAKVTAMKDFDYDAVIDIDDRILETRELIKQMKESKPTSKVNKSDDVYLDQFISENSWMNEDPIMAGAAINVDNLLLKDPKWANVPTYDRLNEVKRRVMERFNIDNKPSKPGSPDMTSDADKGNIVTLSSFEMEVARGLGLTPKDYAQQKKLARKVK